MRTHSARRTTAVIVGALLPLAVLHPQPAGAADGRTYYVNNTAGSNCSDDHAGTGPEAPWCGFAPANARTFVPGDRLLLARGAVFAEGLSVKGEGSPDAPVVIDAYGPGPRPRIVKNSLDSGLILNNPSHWTVRNLDVGSRTNGESDMRYGIRAAFTTPGHKGLVFEDIHVHDSRVVGLHIVNNGPYTTTQSVLEGLRITRVESSHNAHGVLTSSNKSPTDRPEKLVPGKSGENAFTDVVFDQLHLHDDDNNNGDPAAVPSQIEAGCPDGLALGKVTNAVVTNSVLRGEAGCRTKFGTAAIYLGQARNVLIANNIVTDTPNTSNPDMVAIDHEAATSNVTIRGNYFADNFGGGVEYLAIHGANDFHTDNRTVDNVFTDNGVRSHIPYPPDGAIAQLGDSIPVAAEVSGNLYHEPFGVLTAKNRGDVSRFTQKNNVPVAARSDLSHAAEEFKAPGTDGPWGYAARADGTWRQLPWNADQQAYEAEAGAIDRFTARPGNAAVARTWTAPRSGSVNIRGFALPTGSGSDGTSSVAVTLNGRSLGGPWTSIGSSGRATNSDDLRVRAGDVIRFVTEKGSAPVSWAPAVAYSAESRVDDPAGTWSFSVNGDTRGWTGNTPVSAERGKLEVTASGAVTELRTSRPLDLRPRGRSALRIGLDNDTHATEGSLTFTTAKGRTGTVPFHVNPEEPKGLATAYRDLLVPLGDHKAWDGTLKRLSLKFTDAEGRISIDRIALDSPPVKSWDFTDGAEGWAFNPDVSRPSPGLPVSDVVADADNTDGAFVNHADIAWDKSRMQTFRAAEGSLARLDLWAFRKGETTRSLFLRIVRLKKGDSRSAETLFTGSVAAKDVSTDGGMISVHPNLKDLDPDARYGVQIFAPYQVPGKATYGIGYNDASLYSEGSAYYSVDANGNWHGPDQGGRRSLKFRTFAFADGASSPPPDSGFVPARTDGGKLIGGGGGLEPALHSPDLDLDASEHRYVRIRMNNPDTRQSGYLLFTTADDPEFDLPGDGVPPPNEKGLKGIAFSLVPGAEYTEYVLDMATVPGWKGTITQLKVQPFTRWNYHVADVDISWHGGIDSIRID